MRQRTFNIYTIDEHPDPNAVYDYIRDNRHDLGQYVVDDVRASLEALADYVNGKLEYSISIVPDRGEFVRITDYDTQPLRELYERKDACPLTGVCYDIDVIEGLKNGTLEQQILKVLHNEGEHIYSDESLHELCQINEYEFYENGKIA